MKNNIHLMVVIFMSLLFSKDVKAQQFDYLMNTPTEFIPTDAVEDSNSFWIYGAMGYYPNFTSRYLQLSKSGNFIKDTIDNQQGGFIVINSILRGSTYFITYYKTSSSNDTIIKHVVYNNSMTNILRKYEVTKSNNTDEYRIYNTRILNDSLAFSVGNYGDPFIGFTDFDGFAHILNLNTNVDTLINMGSSNKIDFISDILMIGNKYYFVATDNNYYANCNSLIVIRRYHADFSLDTIVNICSSTPQFSHDQNLHYVANGIKLNESTFSLTARIQNSVSIWDNTPEDIGHVVLDTNFNEINATVFGRPNKFALEGTKTISRFENDSFMYVGGTEEYVVNFSGYDTADTYYMLRKTDLQGNPIWTRYYSNASYLQLNKVLATSDGGALLVGSSYDEKTASGLEKDAWIVKVDSNGDYQNPTSIAENTLIQKEDFVFFPNPVNTVLTFRQINRVRKINLQLFDGIGRLVYDEEINESESQIDVASFSSGTYFYRLVDENGTTASGKVIKQ